MRVLLLCQCRCQNCLFSCDISPFNIRLTRKLTWKYIENVSTAHHSWSIQRCCGQQHQDCLKLSRRVCGMSGPATTHFRLPCYFLEMNSHRADEARYTRLQLHTIAGFTSLHPSDQDLVKRCDIRNTTHIHTHSTAVQSKPSKAAISHASLHGLFCLFLV